MVPSFTEDVHRPARSPRTAEDARGITRIFLSVLEPDDSAQAEAILLAVSELVTNAIRHAGGVTGFGLRADEETVTVRVADASPTPPHRRNTPLWEPGGFGWPLVLELAQEVRVSTHRSGKTVEAVLALAH
ncbi:ATP-binding protein [Streptomyces sp. NPDC001093]|uniref:ATP-binding protein n=1 Tax=Streptomyces sp. NPDC001093 TaxID=3154376 RepID=UPI00331DC25B